jgi:raffinose/stachyose/melibiose transport system permease protein
MAGWTGASRWLRRHRSGPPGQPREIGYAYLLPAAALYGLFVLSPLYQGGWISLFHWDGINPATWAGLDNYREVVSNPQLRTAFSHSLVLVLFNAVLPIALALLITTLLSRARQRGVSTFRAVFFLPQILPVVAIGVAWRWIYAPDGPLNGLLSDIGLGALSRGWLGDFTLALPAVGLVGTWTTIGFCVVLFLAGVQNIPTDLYDAAQIDGAGRVQEFLAVTLPGLRNELVVAAVVTTIAALRSFDLIYVTTQGGPGNSTAVPSWEVYRRAFQFGDFGSAAAVGMTLATIILVVVVVLTRALEPRETAT